MTPKKVVRLDSLRTLKQMDALFERKYCTFYTLDAQHNIIPTKDVLVWGKFFESTKVRIVAQDAIGDIRISTVFLGIDHGFEPGPPILFETMIFGGAHDQEQWRYSTWDEAETGHRKALTLVRQELSK